MSWRATARLALLRLVPRVLGQFSVVWGGGWVEGGMPPRVLLIRPDHLGDLVLLTPALRALREAAPKAHITLLIGPWGKEVLADNPCVDEVLTCPFPWFDRQPARPLLARYRLLWAEAKRLHAHRFDAAVVLRFDFWWGALLAYLAGIPERVGYDLPEVRPFLTRVVPYRSGRHEVLQDLTLVSHLAEALPGAAPVDPDRAAPLEFPGRMADEVAMNQWLATAAGERPLLVLQPGAGAPVKRWRAEGFARVANHLAQEEGFQVVLTGTPAERPLLDEVASQLEAPALVRSDLSLGQLGVLFRRARLAIGVDGGAMHLAAAVGTPSVHLYGPVDARTFGPWGDPARHAVVVRSDLPCLPCNRLDWRPEDLPAHPCIRDIDPELVLDGARRVIAGLRAEA